METFRILPVLGLKDDVPEDDYSLYQFLGDGIAKTHCVQGRNFDVSRQRNAASKSTGKALWSNTATATTQTCLGIFELYDGTNRVLWVAMRDGSNHGRLFRYDSGRDPVRISDVVGHAGAIEFAYDTTDFYSFIRYGSHMIFADRAEHTPYCSDFNDTALVKLISSGTEYKFRYLESWQNRIFGAYSDQTNGDIDVRWSNLLPVPATDCVFAAANQLYVPNDDPITGIKRMGRNNCFLYCENSINRIMFYPEQTRPFSIVTVVDDVGATNHHSIVDAGGVHFFYNYEYGFLKFDGNMYTPISDDIKGTTQNIKFTTHPYIIGTLSELTSEIVWTVAADSGTSPNCLLIYNYRTNTWRRKDLAMRYVAPSRLVVSISTMQNLIDLGYTTWSDFGNKTMEELLSETSAVAFSNTDGHLYYDGSESDAGSAWDGYRIEPVMDFGNNLRKDLLLEIWFNLTAVGNYSLYVYHRSGNTVGEVLSAPFSVQIAVSCNNPESPVCRLNKTGRYHQIMWGTSGAGQPFVVREIQFNYQPLGVY